MPSTRFALVVDAFCCEFQIGGKQRGPSRRNDVVDAATLTSPPIRGVRRQLE